MLDPVYCDNSEVLHAVTMRGGKHGCVNVGKNKDDIRCNWKRSKNRLNYLWLKLGTTYM